MATPRQMIWDTVLDKVQQGLLTVAEGNVLMVQMEGVRLINNRLTRELRGALNAAVKRGDLGHLPKEGHKPEAYFHKNARPRALEERAREERRTLALSRTVMVHYADLVPAPEATQ